MARVRNDEQYAAQRSRILTTAAKLIRAKGYQAMTMDDLANALGITKAAVYYYFPKKDEILLEICEQALDAALTQLRAIDPELSADKQIEQLIFDHMRILVDNLEEFSVFFQEIGLRRDARARRVLARQHQFTDDVVAMVQRGVDTGACRALDARLVTMALLGMCNWTYRWYRSEGRSVDDIAGEFADLLRIGVSARAPGPAGSDGPAGARTRRVPAQRAAKATRSRRAS